MTTTTIAAPRSGPPRRARTAGRSNYELYAWVFMRASGVLLLVLIFGHLFMNLIAGDGIKAVDFGFVAGKWASPLWQVWDLLMLWLAMIHGCLLYTSDAADEEDSVDLGGRRIIKKKKTVQRQKY